MEMEKVLIIYHSADIDGIVSGAMVGDMLTGTAELNFMGYHYNEPYDIDFICSFNRVYIADVQLPDSAMLQVAERTQLFWFDHHQTSYQFFCSNTEAFANASVYFPNANELGNYSCTDVIYKYLFNKYPTRRSDPFFYFIGRYDIFDKTDLNAWEQEIVPLQRFLSSILLFPSDFLDIQDSLKSNIWEYIAIGRMMYNKEKHQARQLYKKLFTCTWQGFKCLVSEVGKRVLDVYALDHPDADFDIIVSQTPIPSGGFGIGIYNYPGKTHNLAEIAKKFGGGGHRDAAGFTTQEIIFK
jgi:oligoribonuclease NrnB/cAMP/cGMP phosphodiesterase (DHH superfamily)